MRSSIRNRPWTAVCELMCMLADLRTDAPDGDLDLNLIDMNVAEERSCSLPVIDEAQHMVFNAFRNYLSTLKSSRQKTTMNRELEENPKWACVALDELLEVVDEKADAHDLERIRTRINPILEIPDEDACIEDTKKIPQSVQRCHVSFPGFCGLLL